MAEDYEDDETKGGGFLQSTWSRLVLLGLVGAIVIAAVLLATSDKAGDEVVDVRDTTAHDPAPPASDTAATEPKPTTPPPAPSLLTDDEIKALGDVLGPASTAVAEGCAPTAAFVHQTGGEPLLDPSLSPRVICPVVADLDGDGLPELADVADGQWLIIAAFHYEPLDPPKGIRMQPGVGFDHPGLPNNVPGTTGEGFEQIPLDTIGWLQQPTGGWGPVTVYDVTDGYSITENATWFSHLAPDSPLQIFVLPVDDLTPDTTLFWQSFGRQSAPGSAGTAQDPAASHRIDFGPLGGCILEPGPCGILGTQSRFRVELDFETGTDTPGDPPPLTQRDLGDGTFWFFNQGNVELVIKILDGCGVNNRYWVFASGITEERVSIEDTEGEDAPAEYHVVPGAPIMDTEAFATCP